MKTKEIIGMVHLKALPTAPNHKLNLNEIFDAALKDLNALEEGGIKTVIIENLFDIPYEHRPNLDTLISLAILFTRLKAETNISLGLNVQATDGIEEMTLATYLGADFIRAESFVETRITSSGIIQPMAPGLMREKRRLNSKVRILADINVKHSNPVVEQPLEALIQEAIEAGADGIILTGVVTGKAPTAEDAKRFKSICGETALFIGSGVDLKNAGDLLQYADGAIVGSSIKKDRKIENPIDIDAVKALMAAIND